MGLTGSNTRANLKGHMGSIYIAILFALIATAYFFTTGDPYGTLGILPWFLYYAGLVTAEEELLPILDKITNRE